MDGNGKRSILIVGGGLAGLAAGCYGRMNGYRTTIFETNLRPGGCCSYWRRGGFMFDGCLQYLAGTAPDGLFGRMWSELGALHGRRVFDFDTFNVVRSADGSRTLRMYTDLPRLEQELLRFSPRDEALIRDIVASVRLLLKGAPALDKPTRLMGPLEKLRALSGSLPFIRVMMRWRGVSLKSLSERFQDPLLRHAFGVVEFPGLPAFQFLLMLALVASHNAGLPEGGAEAFVGAIAGRYADLGGELRCGSRVTRIIVERGRAAGIELEDGSEERGTWVVAAGDRRRTVCELLRGAYRDDKVIGRRKRWKAYDSGLRISIGANRDLSGEPPTQTLVLDRPAVIGGEERAFLVMRHFSYDRSFAPPGKSAVSVFGLAHTAYWRDLLAHGRERYQAAKGRVAREVIAELDRRYPGLGSQVEVADVATPVTFERYTGNTDGSIEGWQPVVGGPGIMTEVPVRLDGLAGLVLAGHWTFVGGGTGPAANSGRNAVQLICHADGRPFRTSLPPGSGDGSRPRG